MKNCAVAWEEDITEEEGRVRARGRGWEREENHLTHRS